MDGDTACGGVRGACERSALFQGDMQESVTGKVAHP